MEVKKYASYAEIERDLEVLKLEKEISYQKLMLSFQQTKDSVTPQNIVSGFLAPYKDAILNPISSLIRTISPYVISFIMSRRNK
jgi:hypothetical protein